jgi:hypothetical protein
MFILVLAVGAASAVVMPSQFAEPIVVRSLQITLIL